jgi:hypothetical protein
MNIQLMPEGVRHYKSRQLVNHNIAGEYDIWMMEEVGLYWGKLDSSDQWEERALIGSLHNITAVFANNTTEPQEPPCYSSP